MEPELDLLYQHLMNTRRDHHSPNGDENTLPFTADSELVRRFSGEDFKARNDDPEFIQDLLSRSRAISRETASSDSDDKASTIYAESDETEEDADDTSSSDSDDTYSTPSADSDETDVENELYHMPNSRSAAGDNGLLNIGAFELELRNPDEIGFSLNEATAALEQFRSM